MTDRQFVFSSEGGCVNHPFLYNRTSFYFFTRTLLINVNWLAEKIYAFSRSNGKNKYTGHGALCSSLKTIGIFQTQF